MQDTNEVCPLEVKINKKFLRVQNKYALLSDEIRECGRQIKIWQVIGQAKKEFKGIKSEYFWGWLQHTALLRLIYPLHFKMRTWVNAVFENCQ